MYPLQDEIAEIVDADLQTNIAQLSKWSDQLGLTARREDTAVDEFVALVVV